MSDRRDEQIERGRESLQRMERVIDRHTNKPGKAAPPPTRGDSWGAGGHAGGVVRGAARTPTPAPKK
jgi:hypothetical protein